MCVIRKFHSFDKFNKYFLYNYHIPIAIGNNTATTFLSYIQQIPTINNDICNVLTTAVKQVQEIQAKPSEKGNIGCKICAFFYNIR